MNPATWKILELITGVVAYELKHSHDGFLLSEEADRWVERYPIGARVAIVSVFAVITLHIANLLAPEFDPMSKTVWRTILRRARGNWSG